MDCLSWSVSLWAHLALLCVVLLYIYGTCCMHTWKRLAVPGPAPVPFFGNAHQFFNPAIGVRASVRKWQEQYGKIFGVHFFRKPCLVITDMDALKEILVRRFNEFPDRFFIGGGKIFPDVVNRAMTHQKVDGWKRLRRIMSPSFTSGKLKLLTVEMNRKASQLADIMLQYAQNGTQPAVKDIYSAYALDLIAKTAFGLDTNAMTDRSDEFSTTAKSLVTPKAGTRLALATVGVFPLAGLLLRKLKFALFSPTHLRRLENSLIQLVIERKKNPTDSLKRMNFLQLLIQAKMDHAEDVEGDRKLSVEEIASQGIMFIYAGYETTSSTLQYMSYNLARHQEVQERVLQEMRTVVGDAKEITYVHCDKMKYTEAVIHETIRLYPPVHLLFREALQDTTVQGLHIPAKTGILVPVYNIGQDPELFPQPETFNPDRFLGEEKISVAFGMGPKTCMGLRLAMLEIKIAFFHLLRKIHFVDASPDKIEIADYTAFPSLKSTIHLSLETRINF